VETAKSIYNPILTLDYMVSENEKKFFDRKSGKLKPSDISDLISAFANCRIRFIRYDGTAE
jgi:hypothetical protein